MFDVHFLGNPSYETTPKWHGFLMIKLAASATGCWADPPSAERFQCRILIWPQKGAKSTKI
jgi:hypothetical protein